jgi:hypothetical protein
MLRPDDILRMTRGNARFPKFDGKANGRYLAKNYASQEHWKSERHFPSNFPAIPQNFARLA